MLLKADLLDLLKCLDDMPSLGSLLDRSTEILGFDYFSFYWHSPVANFGRPVVIDSYPKGWISHYRDREYYRVDPVLKSLPRSNQIRVWSNEFFRVARPLWDDARDAGLRFGASQTLWCRNGVAVLSLSRRRERIDADEVSAVNMTAMWITNVAVQQIEQSLSLDRTSSGKLSRREREVMQWTADGKNATEVARLVGISRRTVEFHVANATEKLCASNKAHAVSLAIQNNEIELRHSGKPDFRGLEI